MEMDFRLMATIKLSFSRIRRSGGRWGGGRTSFVAKSLEIAFFVIKKFVRKISVNCSC